ncbi:MAG: HAD family phosphatase [Acidobacteria bacterium]|nr:MAG: HAD family phosphatase [Acidobacteriota bacterium]
MHIRGLIFDFNGVIVDDEPLHAKAVQRALQEENFLLSMPEYYDKYLPFDDYHCLLNILRDHGEACDDARIRKLIGRKSFHYFTQIQENIPALKGSTDFIRSLPAHLPLVIASGAARREIEFILAELGLRDCFLALIASGDVVNSKPHPEAFLKGFEILQTRVPDLAPAEVVVFEDSYRGVESALAAGLRCVGICTSYAAERLQAADLVIETLDGWNLERLEATIRDS